LSAGKNHAIVNYDKLTYAVNKGEVYNIGGSHVEENLAMAQRPLRLTGKLDGLLRYVTDRLGHDRRYALGKWHQTGLETGDFAGRECPPDHRMV
jgi:hypothetical protein